jgi:chemotaxis protein CheY-P-specific phosphatase CheC
MPHVGPDERDAVGEVFNIAIGNAREPLARPLANR